MKPFHRRLSISTLAVCLAAAACGGQQPNAAPQAAAPQAGAAAVSAPAVPANPPAASPAPAPMGTSGPAASAAPPATAPAVRPAKRKAAAPPEPAPPESVPVAEAAAPIAAAPPPGPPPPTEPRYREITIPEGTTLALRLTTPLASDRNRVEDPVTATVSSPVSVDGVTVIPDGAEVNGTVLDVKPSGRVKGLASIVFRFDRMHARNETHAIVTEGITQEAKSTKGKDAAKVGIAAGAGAVIGAIAGGDKGAAIGSIVGGGAGAGAVAATKGEEVRLPAGTPVTTTLRAPLVVRMRIE